MSDLTPQERDALVARLTEVSAQLTMMEKAFAFSISIWAALEQEKLSLEHRLHDVGLKDKLRDAKPSGMGSLDWRPDESTSQ